jgi:drug/metabolite transporter (DMT)-like permease
VIAFIGVVSLALVAQYMIFTSTSMIEPSKTMPFGYLGIIVGFTADIFYFKIEFDFLSVLGMFLTSIGLLSKLIIEKIGDK